MMILAQNEYPDIVGGKNELSRDNDIGKIVAGYKSLQQDTEHLGRKRISGFKSNIDGLKILLTTALMIRLR